MSQYVKDLLSIWFVPDQFKTQEMWNKTVQSYPWALKCVPDQYKTQEMCNEAEQSDPEVLEYVPDQYKTQEMWHKKYKVILGRLNMFLISIKLKKCAMKQWKRSLGF